MNETIGIIGVGEFAEFLLRGWVRHNPDVALVLSPRNRERSARLAARHGGATIAADNAEVVAQSTIVLLATRPKELLESVRGLPWREEQLALSVAAGVNLAELGAATAPAPVSLFMATNSAALGVSPIPLYPSHPRAAACLAALGRVCPMPDEHSFEAASVMGAYYGWVMELARESAGWLEHQRTPPQTARALVTSLLRGAADMIDQRKDEPLQTLVDEMRTPGGITEHGLQLFERSGALREWPAVCEAVLARLAQRY